MTEMIENKTFDEIRVGETASLVHAFRREDVETWAAVTGNLNLVDLDPSPLDSSMFPHGAGQAMWRRQRDPRALVIRVRRRERTWHAELFGICATARAGQPQAWTVFWAGSSPCWISISVASAACSQIVGTSGRSAAVKFSNT